MRRAQQDVALYVSKLVEQWKEMPTDIGVKTPLPDITENDFIDIVSEYTNVLAKQSQPIVKADSSFIAVGSIYGNVNILIQIFAHHGIPPEQNYIFLGNIINFGEFSLETMITLLSLALCFPKNVLILRDTQEYYQLNGFGALFTDVKRRYNSNLSIKYIEKLFTYLPLGCMLNNNILCLNPNILLKYKSLEKIQKLKNAYSTSFLFK